MTDKDLAQLQLGIYGVVSVKWNTVTNANSTVVYGTKFVDGVTVVVLRGSVTRADWLLDFKAISNPFAHSGLGPVHPGFFFGMEATWAAIKKATSGPRMVIGHSLGAARAAILAGLMALDKEPPIARVVWGEPKSGFATLAKLIGGIPTRSYRNGDGRVHDPVTDVPLSFPPEEYERATALTDVCSKPTDTSILSWHHMPLYAAAMK